MEAGEIPGAAAFSTLKGRATCQPELDEPFIVWPARGVQCKASLFAKIPQEQKQVEKTEEG